MRKAPGNRRALCVSAESLNIAPTSRTSRIDVTRAVPDEPSITFDGPPGMRRTTRLLLGMIPLLAACDGGPVVPSEIAARAELLVESRRENTRAIYATSADGRLSVRLSGATQEAWSGQWSPDGRRIVYVAATPDQGPASCAIHVMDADGTDQVPLVVAGHCDPRPAWSPDGSRIAFDGQDESGRGIFVIDADGSNLVRFLPPSLEQVGRLRWSPDGSMLAYLRTPYYGPTPSPGSMPEPYLVVSDAAGALVTHIFAPSHTGGVGDFAWHPDGTRIVFMYGGSGVAIAAASPGSTPVGLTGFPAGMVGVPLWSPDGGSAAFSVLAPDDDVIELYVSDADGANRKLITSEPAAFDYRNRVTSWRRIP